MEFRDVTNTVSHTLYGLESRTDLRLQDLKHEVQTPNLKAVLICGIDRTNPAKPKSVSLYVKYDRSGTCNTTPSNGQYFRDTGSLSGRIENWARTGK